MKAILEFDLNEPDDCRAHLRAVKSLDLALALNSLDNYLKNRIEHTNLSKPQYEEAVTIQKRFTQELLNNNINLDELSN